MASSLARHSITMLSGRFHSVGESFGKLLVIGEDNHVRLECFHPDQARWCQEGRYDAVASSIRFHDGTSASVDRSAPHLLMVDGHPYRRLLDDGTVVDYPRTTRGTFLGGAVRIHLEVDGGMTFEQAGDHGGMAERGRYDLYRGFAHLEHWSRPRTIALLPGGDLRVGEERFRRVG